MSLNTIQPSGNSNLNTIRSEQYASDKNCSKTNLSQMKSNTNSKLFYIKSKHTEKYFRNHNYFSSGQNLNSNRASQGNQVNRVQTNTGRKSILALESVKNNKSQIVSKKSIQETSIKSKSKNKQIINVQRMKQFVNEPTQFGIDNTYKYLKNKSFLFKSEHMIKIKNSIQRQRQRRIYTQMNQSSQEGQQNRNYLRQTVSQEKRFLQTLKQRKLSFANKKRQSNRFLSHYQDRAKQSPNNKCQANELSVNKIYNTASLSDLGQTKSNLHEPVDCNITFIYGVRILNYGEINYRKITVNIFPFIINSFLKCKIKYTQFTASDFQFIKNAIFKVIYAKKAQFDIKDIINIGSIKMLIKHLEKFPQMSAEWAETIRYFFIAQQNILEYQLQKLKDELRKLSALKYDAQLNSKELFLFNTQTGQIVHTLFDVFKGSSFIFSDKKEVYDDFNNIVSSYKERNLFSKKVSHWKHLAEDQHKKNKKNIYQNQNNAKNKINRNSSQIRNSKMSEQKFNILFQNSRKRHSKGKQKEKPLLKQFVKSSEFINRHKLKRDEDIFE